jgi:nanoRNase/pAp phosphatase (c-di-AMP/oligoRNAs hydrolase)
MVLVGILTDPSLFSISSTLQDNYTMTTSLNSNLSDNDIVITNVAPSDHKECREA